MAKAVAIFTGVDSYCRRVVVAIREDMVPFFRIYEKTRYGVTPSSWAKDSDACPEYVKAAIETGRYSWGFKTLHGGLNNEITSRLPN